ncbi:class gamma glutathione S-transferase 2 [Halteromyces radiatus]|uniref:class gamma glutathione S-transferase 2 n=1 Tax=Halteromyces radiatus TaxID=101107 RepID=UPI0022211751|nr:class gamma glutathione S-transferase 2 [Halteromyces radiatus]KAI8092646.1 class gamma glutathione S-transferase 2 [Halteromyces radiatus]
MISSPITLHYFVFEGEPSIAFLGENLNLLLKDSGVEYTYVRHKYADWPSIKKELSEKMIYPTMPYIELDGKLYNKTAPTMRYLCKKLGKYLPANDDDQYILEVAADVTRDHYGTRLPLYRCEDKEKWKEHFEKDTTKYLNAYESIYQQNEGPYILGEEITYADFLVYHIIQDDNALKHVQGYPHVAKFIDAFSQRPNLTEYIASLAK